MSTPIQIYSIICIRFSSKRLSSPKNKIYFHSPKGESSKHSTEKKSPDKVPKQWLRPSSKTKKSLDDWLLSFWEETYFLV